jgi:hypothetical protein
MKKLNIFKLVGIIAFVAVIMFSMASCEIDKENEKETSLEGSWGSFYSMYEGEFTFSGDNFDYQAVISARRKGTFTKTSSHLTFNSTHEYSIGIGDWVILNSPPAYGVVNDHVNFLDSGNPVSYKFEHYDDGKLRGITIGDTLYNKH